LFLKAFVDGIEEKDGKEPSVHWAHIDIAGTMEVGLSSLINVKGRMCAMQSSPLNDAFTIFTRGTLLYSMSSVSILIADHLIAVHASDTIPGEGDDWPPRPVSGLMFRRYIHLISSSRALVEFVRRLSTQ
jgi:hypothetical protein